MKKEVDLLFGEEGNAADNSGSSSENEEKQGYVADSDLSTIVGKQCQFRFQVLLCSMSTTR